MSGIPSYKAHTKDISSHLAGFRSAQPDLMKAFGEMSAAATRDGALDAKTKELIALALAVAAHCDACIGFHVKALVKLGATPVGMPVRLFFPFDARGSPWMNARAPFALRAVRSTPATNCSTSGGASPA